MECMILLMALLPILVTARLDVFTSLQNLKTLLEAQKTIADSLQQYILNMEENLAILKQYINRYQEEATRAKFDGAKYLGNPINTFTLVKRMTKDIQKVEDLLTKSIELTYDVEIDDNSLVVFPDAEDLTESALALIRIQDYYHLPTSDLARGILDEIHDSNPMTVGDCYELGSELLKQGEYMYALAWTTEAYKKAQLEYRDIPIQDIMEKISIIHHHLNDTEEALDWNNRALQIGQTESVLERKIMLNKILERKLKSGNDTAKRLPTTTRRRNAPGLEIYQGLCRGEYRLQHNITKRLKCRYESRHHPFLKLAPMKLEEIFLDPDVVIFHDVILPGEIQAIIDLGQPKLRRSKVLSQMPPGHGYNAGTVERIRVSENAWVRDAESPVVALVSRRVSDMTGLNTGDECAEPFQLASYVMGGHYEPHLDPITVTQIASDSTEIMGDRIATVILYLNEVDKGGDTVFTSLGVSVAPLKGSALVWRNLHPSGQIDQSLMHGACPVLRGHKWIATKWIHEWGQEFRSPCTLEYRGRNYTRNLPPPFKLSRLN